MNDAHIFSYRFYQVSFAVVLCALPLLFLKYTACVIVIYIAYRAAQSCLTHLSSRSIGCEDRGVIVTGCDSGFGYDFAKHLHEIGFTVFAGCLHVTSDGARLLQSQGSIRLHVIRLDVTSDSDVTTALQYVKQHLPKLGLWGAVNNAGMNHYGEIEFLTVNHYRRLLDVNLWGHLRITQAFLPLIRSSKGRIVMISSVHGRFYWPRFSAYGVSKAAIETIADSLRLEMAKFGVKVAIVEPGSFAHATSITDVHQVARCRKDIMTMWHEAPQHIKDGYSESHVLSWLPPAKGGQRSRGDSGPVFRAVEHALTSDRPNTRYLVAGTALVVDHMKVLAVVAALVPTWITDMYLAFKTGCHRFH